MSLLFIQAVENVEQRGAAKKRRMPQAEKKQNGYSTQPIESIVDYACLM